MLARRVVTQPAITIRQLGGSRLQLPSIHSTRSQLQVLPRPNTWLAKIRFRADGKPRSKLIAFTFVSLIVLNIVESLAIKGTKIMQDHLETMICIRKVDFAYYDSVNFDDPISTILYFKKFYTSIRRTRSTEENGKGFDLFMMRLIRKKTREGLEKSAKVEIHDIMRSAAKKVHDAFQELNQDSTSKTATIVVNAITEAGKSLRELYGVEKDARVSKDARVLKDYEVIG